MTALLGKEQSNSPETRRWPTAMIAAAVLLAAEFLALMLRFTTASFEGAPQQWAHVLSRSTILPQLALTSATAVALFSSHALERELRGMRANLAARTGRVKIFVPQLLCFALLYLATQQIFEGRVEDKTAPWGWIGLWVVAAMGTIIGGAGLFLSMRDLFALARRSKGALLIAPTLGIAAWGIGVLSADALRLPLRTPTLWLSRSLLGLFTDDMVIDVPEFVFGTPSFSVRIAPQCSGLEGVGLLLAFTASYLWIARDSLRFPRALLIPMMGMLAAWVFNSVRLAALVAVGTWVSPNLAVEGFHTLAGLIAFCGISLGLVYWTRRSAFFTRAREAEPVEKVPNQTLALLAPFLAFVAGGLLLELFDARRAELYPLQPLAAVVVIILLRKSYTRPVSYGSWLGVATGIAAFLVWSILSRIDGGGISDAAPHPNSGVEDAWPHPAWLAARILGFGLVTPLVEELAFRSYLLRRLTARDWEHVPLEAFSWTALFASSLLFGALHGAWLPATSVGLMYGLVLRYRGRLSDALLAHATTNLLVMLQAWWQHDWGILG